MIKPACSNITSAMKVGILCANSQIARLSEFKRDRHGYDLYDHAHVNVRRNKRSSAIKRICVKHCTWHSHTMQHTNQTESFANIIAQCTETIYVPVVHAVQP